MPDNSYASYENNNGLRRFYSCQLCDWVKSITGKKPNVYIPKTFTWSADSLANYYSIKLSKIAEKQLKRDHHDEEMHFHNGIAGSSSISMFEVFRSEKYATICVYEYYGLSSMYHYFYKYSYYTVEVNNAGAIHLVFNSIFNEEYTNDVLKMLAEGLVEARFGLGKQVEDYQGDFSELKTDHVALVPEGVLFYYAPYEQGSFSEGQINVILPYDSIIDFLNPAILECVGQAYHKDMFAREEYDYDGLDTDSLLQSFFQNNESFEKEISMIGSNVVISAFSEDKKVRLFTIDWGGLYATGTSYVIYRDDEANLIVKKIAEIKPALEGGGVDLSGLYLSVNNTNNGYAVNGIIGFSRAESELCYDTLFVSNDFLESDCFDIYDYHVK